MNRFKLWISALSILLAAGVGAAQDAPAMPHSVLPLTSQHEARLTVQRGFNWLARQQAPDGSFSMPVFPALTGLALMAYFVNYGPASAEQAPEWVNHALDFVIRLAQPDGSIYQDIPGQRGGGLVNYNTAICVMALKLSGRAEYADPIARAREKLIGLQYLGDGPFHGGLGYDAATDRPYADLSNTYLGLEAIRLTAEHGDQATGAANLNWQAALQFLSRCQNLAPYNDQPWVATDPNNVGGFVYHPEKSHAGELDAATAEVAAGTRQLRSYASMTYAGLLSFLYAELERTDPRVQAAHDWISRHFTVTENPGMGRQGLYFNYHTMAKALSTLGLNYLELPGGQKVNWRQALVTQLITTAISDPPDGVYWVNDNGRWMENDPVLTTSYTLLALGVCAPEQP